jgi:hypothetical protein
MKSIWDKTEQEVGQEIANKNVSEVQKQTIFMLEMLKNIGEAIQENKEITVANIVRHVIGKVSVERPEWIKELKIDLRGFEKRLDYIASAIIRKEVVKKMDFNRPDWIKELIPKEVKFPNSIDFSKPTVDELKKILTAIEKQEKIEEVKIKGEVEIKKPLWYKPLDIASPFISFATFIKKYFDSVILKVNVQNDLKVEIKNKELDVNVKNHQKEITIKNIKELTSRLDLLASQLRSIGTTGSNGGGSGNATSEKQDDVITKIPTTWGCCADSLTATYQYFFFEDKNLNYKIVRETLATGVIAYATGTGGYSSVYVNNTSDPAGSPTWGTYGEIF